MNRNTIVVSAPADTYSGYGARSRDLIRALINLDKYDVKILSQRWGNTRFGYLKDHKEKEISSRIIDKVEVQPDIWMQITVPNEFQAMGKYNIGVTAGIETTLCHGNWLEGCNRMNLVLTSSEHSKKVFQETVYDKVNNNTKQSEGTIKLTTPIEILLEGVDLNKYFPTKVDSNIEIVKSLDAIKESFCFLSVGHWMQGIFGEDRKNIAYLIKVFTEVFKNKMNKPALILKTQKVGSSIMDQEAILNHINGIRKESKGTLPKIYLLHGDITDNDMNQLYNHPKVKSMVSFTKGEGFGRPLLEFSLTGKPIIASGWSGQIDFLDRERAVLVGGTLENVHESASSKEMILTESKWFKPDDNQAGHAIKQVYKKYKGYLQPAKSLANTNKKEYSFEAMESILKRLLDTYIPEFPKQVELKLPSLKLPKLVKNG
tara:strand:+ start:2933 stop:4222 length:1290 start_codon:yes stop_codon:yes gene_type:complete